MHAIRPLRLRPEVSANLSIGISSPGVLYQFAIKGQLYMRWMMLQLCDPLSLSHDLVQSGSQIVPDIQQSGSGYFLHSNPGVQQS